MTAKAPAISGIATLASSAVDAEAILRATFGPGTRRFDIVRRHGEQVAARVLKIAAELATAEIEEDFLYEAAMLHDIGIVKTATPQLDCHGDQPYIRHGLLGRQMLEARGLPRHALVCERHVGAGITAADIRRRDLPLPRRDMCPVTIEEKLICYADKFFSKTNGQSEKAQSAQNVVNHLKTYGRRQAETFIRWAARFEGLILNHNDDWNEGRHN